MDNVTHALIGFTMARAARGESPKSPSSWSAALWTCILGNNLADLDTLVVKAFGGGHLEFLLHHRGYTHTIAFAPVIGAISALAGALIGRVRFRDRRALAALFALGLLSALMHLAADSWNDYGVHPFWPLVDRWFYGDFIFILEPYLWFAMLPLVFFEAESRWGRYLGLGMGVSLLAFIWGSHAVAWPAAAGLTLWCGGVTLAQRQWKGPLTAFVAGVAALAFFAIGSHAAKSEVRIPLGTFAGSEQIRQLVVSPAPGNPFCWRVEVASIDSKTQEYVARAGNLSLWPKLFDPSTCNPRTSGSHLAPLVETRVPSTVSLEWSGEFRRPLKELTSLSETNCRFEALRRFARVPFWTDVDGKPLAGDLRYDLHRGPGFAEAWLDPSQGCARAEPPWIPPFP